MTFFDSIPSMATIVSSTASEGAVWFNAWLPALYMVIGLAIGVLTVAVIIGGFHNLVDWIAEKTQHNKNTINLPK